MSGTVYVLQSLKDKELMFAQPLISDDVFNNIIPAKYTLQNIVVRSKFYSLKNIKLFKKQEKEKYGGKAERVEEN